MNLIRFSNVVEVESRVGHGLIGTIRNAIDNSQGQFGDCDPIRMELNETFGDYLEATQFDPEFLASSNSADGGISFALIPFRVKKKQEEET